MKTTCFLVALFMTLSFRTLSEASRPGRFLSQAQDTVVNASLRSCIRVSSTSQACATVSAQTIDVAANSIATALATAIAEVEGDGDVRTSAYAFAVAIAQSYARIISDFYDSVTVEGQLFDPCVFRYVATEDTAIDLRTATSRGFATSLNDVFRAVAQCFSNLVSQVAATTTLNLPFENCPDEEAGVDLFFGKIQTTDFVQTVAEASGGIFIEFRNSDVHAAVISCIESHSGSSGTTVVSSG